MGADSNNEFRIKLFEDSQRDSTLRCHLSPVFSAVDMEIRWFKETECVCFYKNRRLIEGESYKGIMSLCIEELKRGIVSLQLKDVKESCVGDYLCQVTSGNKMAEITIRASLQTYKDQNETSQQITTLGTEQTEKQWTDMERINMVNSALLAVFNTLEKNDLQKKDPQGADAAAMQTDINIEENQDQTEKKDTQQEYTSRRMNESMDFSKMEMDTSEPVETTPGNNTSYLRNQQPACSSQKSLASDVKVYVFSSGNTKCYDKTFTDILKSRIENLTEDPSVYQSDIILAFCPVVSRAGTDIDTALEIFNYKTETQLAVLVVLHHTFDSKKVIPDSSRYVKRTDILTVDCLFNEDTGLLNCQKNLAAADKVVNWLIQQRIQTGVKIHLRQNLTTNYLTTPGKIQQKSEQLTSRFSSFLKRKMGNNEPSSIPVHSLEKVKVFSIFSGKIKNCQKEFYGILRNRIENLKEGRTVDESDIILLFCPIFSRPGTDIDSALNKITYSTGSKPTVLVVLHHTFDSEKVVLDSSQYVKRTDILTVDCLFNEDTGLLKCQKNSDAAHKAVNWLKQQGEKRGITVPCQYKSSRSPYTLTPSVTGHTVDFPKQKPNVRDSSCPVDYFVHVTKDTFKCDEDFIKSLQQRVSLRKVQKVQESEILLLFCPVYSQSDISSALQEYHKISDKPAVVIFLHETLDSGSVPNSGEYVKIKDSLVVDCIFCDGEGLPECGKNWEAISAAADWIKNKLRDH
ncbi:uncharacterized protein LOC122345659 [Puntigrus tetrazona]|uniref:uncharacterized protein LOC122345659 n=1 Tax=Puntigrus tetrazona TaxID=1606681 RepID=UPI001C89CF3C|nr:uncharacterized protein LOC122345659 [Puntigrus tetrazona]